jgi:hypothetical protein
MRWEQLAGNDRVRFCGHCRQHVYNVASLTMDEAVSLIERCEGRACMRLQRRADGTVITRDCFHVVRRARERLLATALGLAVAAVGFWTGMRGLRSAIEARLVPADPPSCPPPARAEPPELEIPDWLLRGADQQQGGRGLPRPRARAPKPKPPAVKPPEERLHTLGVAVITR